MKDENINSNNNQVQSQPNTNNQPIVQNQLEDETPTIDVPEVNNEPKIDSKGAKAFIIIIFIIIVAFIIALPYIKKTLS